MNVLVSGGCINDNQECFCCIWIYRWANLNSSGIHSVTRILAIDYKNSHQHPILAFAKDITYDITFECFEIRKNLKAL